MGELLGMLIEGKAANWQKPQGKEPGKPKRGKFGEGWHCGSCGFYNSGGRIKCFKCKAGSAP
eukprot:4052441-Amphidinium_carterae.1